VGLVESAFVDRQVRHLAHRLGADRHGFFRLDLAAGRDDRLEVLVLDLLGVDLSAGRPLEGDVRIDDARKDDDDDAGDDDFLSSHSHYLLTNRPKIAANADAKSTVSANRAIAMLLALRRYSTLKPMAVTM